jgi:hypothetical protein
MAEDVKSEEKQAVKPLDKMTVVELREVVKEEIPGITGVTGMKKDRLLEAIKKKKKKTAGPKKKMTSKDMKLEIVRLRAEREKLRQEKDKQKLEIIRRRINRLKKMTRKVA